MPTSSSLDTTKRAFRSIRTMPSILLKRARKEKIISATKASSSLRLRKRKNRSRETLKEDNAFSSICPKWLEYRQHSKNNFRLAGSSTIATSSQTLSKDSRLQTPKRTVLLLSTPKIVPIKIPIIKTTPTIPKSHGRGPFSLR